MRKAIGIVIIVLVVGSCKAAFSQAAPTAMRPNTQTANLTVMYSTLHTNGNVGTCNCTWLSGGAVQIAFPILSNLAVVGEVGAHTTSKMPDSNSGFSFVSGRGGFRLQMYNHSLYQPFGQALFGVAHGFNSYFPAPAPTYYTTSSTTFSTTLGGGLDLAISPRVWIRAAEVDYHYSLFPNSPNNVLKSDRQNELRISAGVVFRFGGGASRIEETGLYAFTKPKAAKYAASGPVECAATPSAVFAGERVYLRAKNLTPDISYSWTSTGGAVSNNNGGAIVDTAGLDAGDYNVTIGHVINDNTRVGDCTSSFTVREFPRSKQVVTPPPPPVSTPSQLTPHDDTAEQLAQLRAQLNEIQKTTESARGLSITLNSVLFNTGKYNLTPDAVHIVQRVAAILKRYRGLEIHVEGYTDTVGSPGANQLLSERRAQTVRDYLVVAGLPAERIVVSGYGENYPVASNRTAAGRSQNRRVDVLLAGEAIGIRYSAPSEINASGRITASN